MPFLSLGETQFYYELHGSQNAPVLVLNNGIIMNAATSWAYQTKTFAQHYQVLQYDMRGQGQSDHPNETYTMELHAADLARIMDALQIPQAHIAGISYGGEVAQAFALHYPQKVLSLVLIDTVSEVRAELAIVIQSWMDALQTGDPLVFFNATVPWNFSPEFVRNNPALFEDAKNRYGLLDFPAVYRLCEAFLSVHFTPDLRKMDAPTCVIAGERDLIKGPEYAQIIQQQIKNSELHILPGAGHATCWEAPHALNSVVLGFLAKVKTS